MAAQTNETAVEVIDRMIETYRNSDIAECLDWIEPLQSARDRIVALSPSPAETDGIREAALEEAARVVDGLIDTYRSSGVDECLDDIGSLRFARDKIRALATKDGDTHE